LIAIDLTGGVYMELNEKNLKKEARQLTKMLRGRTVEVVWRHRKKEVGIQFTDGARLFIDQTPDGLDYSVTYDKCSPEKDQDKPKNKRSSRKKSEK
jgi:hypothetical protein